MESKVGYVDSPTVLGSQSVTLLGGTPKLVLFLGANHGLGGSDQDDWHKFGGAADGTNQHAWGAEPLHAQSPSNCVVAHSNTHCVYVPAASGLRIIEAQFTSMDADGYTIQWTKVWSSSIRIYFIAIWGDTFQAAVGTGQAPTAIGLQDIAVPFEPEAVMCHQGLGSNVIPHDAMNFASSGCVGFGTASSQAVSGWRSNTSDNPQNCSTRQLTDKIFTAPAQAGTTQFREAALDSLLPAAFRLNWTTVNATAAYFFWIAMRGAQFKVGSFTATPGAGNNQTLSGFGFEGQVFFLASANKPAAATTQAHNRMSWGASDGTNKWSIWGGERDNVATTIAATRADITRVLLIGTENNTGPSVDEECGIDTLTPTADGFTVHYDIATATGQEIIYFAIGNAPPPVIGWVTPTHTIEAELNGVGGGWTNITPDTTNDNYRLSYGIKSNRPEVRVGESGTLSFGMRNDANNSGAQLGYYSPFHALKRPGWGFGIRVRLKQVYGADTRYWLGRLDQIVPDPGQFENRRVACVAVDFMNEAARANAPTAIQISKRSDEVFSAVLSNMAAQPENVSVDLGRDTYVYALDNVSQETAVMSIWADLAKSELGIIVCKRDATDGQTLKFESRSARALVTTVVATLDNTMHGLDFPGGRADILNVFRVKAYPRIITASIVIATIDAPFEQAIHPGETKTLFLDYTDPAQRDTKIGATNQIPPAATTDYTMNTAADGSGTNVTASFSVTATFFSSSVMLVVVNNGLSPGHIRTLKARGDGIFALNPVTAEESDAASKAAYGANVASIEMLYQSNPLVASDAALYLKEVFKDPLANARAVRFLANQSEALLTAAITGEISSRVRVVESVSGLTAATEYFINGIEFDISEMETLETTWWLAPASTTVYWQLGIVGASELGVSTRLSY
jgi:hypothetical protein